MRMPFVWLLPVALIIATAVVAGFFAHPIETPTTTPEPTVLATQTTGPSPTPTLSVGNVTLSVTLTPSPNTKSTPSPSPSATTPAEALAKEGPSISFVDLPSTLAAGQPAKITIKIDGPSGTTGDNATIKVKYHTESEKNGSSSSLKSDISNSFGSFTTPATFSMTLSLGQEQAPVELTASAEVDGKLIETSKTIELK